MFTGQRTITTLKRTLWQKVLWWRFRLFEQRRHEQLVLEEVAGHPILVLPGVMNPRLFRTGAFLAGCLTPQSIPAGAKVLDMGTGTGIIAIVAATWARQVVAVDVNPIAVRCARINALLNQVENQVTVHQGDLFAPVVGEQFDVVLFNPPFFQGNPTHAFDYAWRSPDAIDRFAADLEAHLAPDGYALILFSSQGDEGAFLQAFQRHGFRPSIIAQHNPINEVLTVYRFTHAKGKVA